MDMSRRNVHIVMSIVASGSLIVVFIYQLYLIKIPECFENASELGNIFNTLCLSISASSIVYFIVVYLPYHYDNKKIYNYLGTNLSSILRDFKIIFDTLETGKFENYHNYAFNRKDKIIEALDKRVITQNALCFHEIEGIKPMGLYLFIEHVFTSEIDYKIDKLFRRIPNLDTRLFDILVRIETSTFSKRISKLKKTYKESDDVLYFKNYDEEISELYDYIGNLEK